MHTYPNVCECICTSRYMYVHVTVQLYHTIKHVLLQSLFNVHMIQKNKNQKKNNHCIYFSMNLVLDPGALVGPDEHHH